MQWQLNCKRLSGHRYPDPNGEHDHFLALDEELEVGLVKRIQSGADQGRWLWSVTQATADPLEMPQHGTTETRDEAARELVVCWAAVRKSYALD